MCADEPDVYVSDGKFHDYHKAIPVASDIEHIMLVPDIIDTWKTGSYVRKVLPFSRFYGVVPSFQRSFGICMSFLLIEFFQFPM